jgi:hypothetical protein
MAHLFQPSAIEPLAPAPTIPLSPSPNAEDKRTGEMLGRRVATLRCD